MEYTLEQRMRIPEERSVIKDILNTTPLYCKAVACCGYQHIAIEVMQGGKFWFSYTSFNNSEGVIVDIKLGTDNPDITAVVEADVLTEILDNATELMEHPVTAALQYATKFKIPLWQKMKVLTAITFGTRQRRA